MLTTLCIYNVGSTTGNVFKQIMSTERLLFVQKFWTQYLCTFSINEKGKWRGRMGKYKPSTEFEIQQWKYRANMCYLSIHVDKPWSINTRGAHRKVWVCSTRWSPVNHIVTIIHIISGSCTQNRWYNHKDFAYRSVILLSIVCNVIEDNGKNRSYMLKFLYKAKPSKNPCCLKSPYYM